MEKLLTKYSFNAHIANTAVEGHENYAGPEYKDWRKSRNKTFVDTCSLFIVQVLYSLTSSKCIHGKSLQIQERERAKAKAVSVGL